MKFPEIFYGWWIAIGSFLVGIYTNGILVYGFTAMFEPMAQEFGWTHTQISLAASLRGLEEGFLVLIIGALVDRWGPRRFIFSSAIVMALGFIFLINVNSLATFYGAYAVIGIGRSASSGTILATAVVNWFHSKTGIAMAVALSGFMAGGLLSPLLVKLVDSYGWRDTATIITFGLIVIILPLSLLFRHKPEQYGHYPDGLAEIASASKPIAIESQTVKAPVTMRQVLKERAFWQITLAFICQLAAVMALLTHILPFLTNIGIARSTASQMVPLISVTGIASRLAIGYTLDKVKTRLISAVPFLLMTLTMLCFAFAQSGGIILVTIALILFGVSWGGHSIVRATITKEIFGLKRFGSILGLIAGIGIMGAMVGPPFAGWIFDIWQSYQNAWLVFAGLSFINIFSILTIPKKSGSVSFLENKEPK